MWVLGKDKQHKARWKYAFTVIMLVVWLEKNNNLSQNSIIGGNSIWIGFFFLSLGFLLELFGVIAFLMYSITCIHFCIMWLLAVGLQSPVYGKSVAVGTFA